MTDPGEELRSDLGFEVLTASDKAGWETKTALAAAVKLPCSTTATK